MNTHSTAIRTGSVALAVVALALAGCSSDVGTGSDTDGGSGGSGELTVFWKGSEEAGIQAVVAAYAGENPDIDVIVSTADVEQYQSTLRTQLSSGSATDVVFVWPADGNPAALRQIAPGGFLEDLSERPWASQYPEAIAELTQVEGATYLMAPAVTSFGPWYNRTALDEAGLAAPSGWDDVLPFCEDARAAGKTGFAIGAASLNATQNVLYGLVPDLVYADGTAFDDELLDGSATFSENAGWVEAMDKYQQMSEAGCFNDDATGSNQDEQNRLVASGESLGMFGIGFQLAALRGLNPDAEFLLTPFSSDPDSDRNIMTVSNAGGAAVNADSPNKEQAIAFVDFLATPEGLDIYSQALVGAVPSIPTGTAVDDPNLAVINEYLEAGDTVHFLNQFWPNARIEQAMYSGVQGMLAGSQDATSVLTAMDGEIG